MALIVCPWCQSELTVEEGQEPERFCPICDNELGGYRSLRIDIDSSEAEEEEDEEENAAVASNREFFDGDDEVEWSLDGDEELRPDDENLLALEETVERLLDEQETIPECPQCREYMLEAGERIVGAEQFRARTPDSLGRPVLDAPFSLTVYICPSCFAMQHSLAEEGRAKLTQRLSGEERERLV